jgi:hypothetical protein
MGHAANSERSTMTKFIAVNVSQLATMGQLKMMGRASSFPLRPLHRIIASDRAGLRQRRPPAGMVSRPKERHL